MKKLPTKTTKTTKTTKEDKKSSPRGLPVFVVNHVFSPRTGR